MVVKFICLCLCVCVQGVSVVQGVFWSVRRYRFVLGHMRRLMCPDRSAVFTIVPYEFKNAGYNRAKLVTDEIRPI